MQNQESEVVEQFLKKSIDNLANIKDDLLTLEQQGDDIDCELANCIFRDIHAIKGGALFFGMQKIGRVAQHMELALDRVRRKELALSADLVDSLLTGSDLLKEMIGDPSCIPEIRIEEVESSIEMILNTSLSDKEREDSGELVDIKLPDGKVIFSISKYDFQRASEEDRGGSHVYLIKYDLIKDIEENGKTPWEVISELLQLCVFIDSKVDIDSIGTLDSAIPDFMPFYVLISTIIEKELIYDFLELDCHNVFLVGNDGFVVSDSSEDSTEIVESIVDYIIDNEDSGQHLGRLQNICSAGDTSESLDQGSVSIGRKLLESHINKLLTARDQLVQKSKCDEHSQEKRVAELLGSVATELYNATLESDRALLQDSSYVCKGLSEKSIADRLSLIVLKSGNEHFGVPLKLVSTLEKLEADQIFGSDSERSIMHKGKSLEVISICDVTCLGRLDPADEYIVVVIEVSGVAVGFIFNSIVSILNSELKIVSKSCKGVGIIGSVGINGTEVNITDLYSVLFSVKPELCLGVNAEEGLKGVLVVEDSPFFLDFITEAIETLGFVVYSARSGEEAFNVLENYSDNIGIVFTDIKMKGMSGIALLNRIRNDLRFCDLPVFALTAVAGEENINSSEDVEFGGYIVKLDSYSIGLCCLEHLCRH